MTDFWDFCNGLNLANLRRMEAMKIMDFLNHEAVTANLEAKDKEGTIRELVDLLYKAGAIKDKDKLIKILLSREALGSTGIGQGVGIPHGKSEGVTQLVAAFGLSQRGVSFDSLDGESVHIFFLLVAPQDSAGPHLKALARISRLLKDRSFREALKQCKDEKSILRLIEDEDTKRH
jgi:nitrogen PTS system EIIA component